MTVLMEMRCAAQRGRPQGIAPTIHGLAKLIRRIVGAIPCGRPGGSRGSKEQQI